MSARTFLNFPAPYIYLLMALAGSWMLADVLLRPKRPSQFNLVAEIFLSAIVAGIWIIALRYAVRPWWYRVNSGRITAYRFFGLSKTVIRWGDVVEVRKARSRSLLRSWPETEIRGRDGECISVTTNMPNYLKLMETVRRRAEGCKSFDVEPAWQWSRSKR